MTTHGSWAEDGGVANRLVALIRYPSGADPDKLTREYLASAEFPADMKGFDPQDLVGVETILLDATGSSPIR